MKLKHTHTHLSSIDGIKGISILAIVFYHAFPHVFPGGFLWVNTFFVIGGFFLARQVEEKIQASGGAFNWPNLGQLLLKTIARLWIPLAGFFALSLCLIFWLDRPELSHNLWDVVSGLFFFNNYYQIMSEQSYFTQAGGSSPFTHLWYNALYLQAYLIGLVGILLTSKLNLRAIPKATVWLGLAAASHVLMALTFQPQLDPSRAYYGLDTRLSSFAIGIALAYMLPMILNWFAHSQHKDFIFTLSSILLLGLMLIMTLNIQDTQGIAFVLWLPVFSYLSAYLIFLCIVGTPLTQMILGNPILHNLGQRSYSLYLWYYPILHYGLAKNTNWYSYLLCLVCWLVISEWHYLLWEQKGKNLSIMYKWLSLANWQANWAMFKQQTWQIKRICQLILVLFLTCGTFVAASQLRQHKRLGQFEIEYLHYQNQPNISDKAFPASQLIVSNKARLQPLYTALDIKAGHSTFNAKQWLNQLKDPLGLADPLSQTSTNLEILRQFYDSAPELASLLEAKEISFAHNLSISLFGDSVALLNSANFDTLFPQGNSFGEVSLSVYNWGLDRLNEHIANGQILENVVLQLGINGGLTEADVDQLVQMLGERQIFFITTHNGDLDDTLVNTAIKNGASKYDHVHVLDWASYALGHDDWFISDGVHENETGSLEYVAFIGREVYRILQHSSN